MEESLWGEFEFLAGEEVIRADSRVLYDWCKNNDERGERILSEWDDDKNRELYGMNFTARDITIGSIKPMWWKCSRCGNEYKLPVRDRVKYVVGCKKCRTKHISYSETVIYYGLKEVFSDTLSTFKVADEKLEFDIVIPSKNTYIEYSGEYWHSMNKGSDYRKRVYCEENGIRYIEIWEMKKEMPLLVMDDVIIFRNKDSSRDTGLFNVLMEVYRLLGLYNIEIDYKNVLRNAHNRMLKPENSLVDKYPEIIAEWDIDLNCGAKPECFSVSSAKRIRWSCTKCGNIWPVCISSRTQFKTGCPCCGYNIFKKKYKKKNKYK